MYLYVCLYSTNIVNGSKKPSCWHCVSILDLRERESGGGVGGGGGDEMDLSVQVFFKGLLGLLLHLPFFLEEIK